MTYQLPNLKDCGRSAPHPDHRWMLGRTVYHCSGATPAPLSPEREAAARQQIADLIYGTYGQFDHHRTYAIADAVMPAVRAAVAAELDRVRAERAETNGKLVELTVALRAAEKRVAELEGEQPPMCGRTRAITGEQYPPCGRRVGHGEAYCRSIDGSAYFLAINADQVKAEVR